MQSITACHHTALHNAHLTVTLPSCCKCRYQWKWQQLNISWNISHGAPIGKVKTQSYTSALWQRRRDVSDKGLEVQTICNLPVSSHPSTVGMLIKFPKNNEMIHRVTDHLGGAGVSLKPFILLISSVWKKSRCDCTHLNLQFSHLYASLLARSLI